MVNGPDRVEEWVPGTVDRSWMQPAGPSGSADGPPGRQSQTIEADQARKTQDSGVVIGNPEQPVCQLGIRLKR